MDKYTIISKLQVGDTLLVHSGGFLPRNIQRQMKKYSKKTYGKIPDKIFNHMAIVVRKDGVLCLAEAVKEGFVIRPLVSRLNVTKVLNGDHVFYRSIKELTDREKEIVSEESMTMEHTPYEIFNFIWWLIYIKTNFHVFVGKKGLKRVFCYESAWHLIKTVRPNSLHKQDQFGTSVDMQFSDDFKPIKFE